MASRQPQESLYGFTSPLVQQAFSPISSKRAPATNDFASIGRIWINTVTKLAYILVNVSGNVATWSLIEAAAGTGVFTSVEATTGNITADLGNIIASAGGVSAATSITGASLGATTGNIVAALGNISASSGSVSAATLISAGTSITAGTGIIATTGNIVATTGAVQAGAAVTAGTSMTATAGNITATNGDFVASTAAKGVVLGGGAKVVCGTGDPNGAVTAPQGSLYLNLTGSTTATRAFINSTGGTIWIAVTTAS